MKYKASIFECFPNIELDCKDFIFENFENSHVEMLKDELISIITPRKMTKLNQDPFLSKESEEYILIEHPISNPLRMHGVEVNLCNWVFSVTQERSVIIRYGHEKPDQQRHRSKFIYDYLTKIEPTIDGFNRTMKSLIL